MKILTIVGARPQFIKAAILSHCITDDKDISEVIVHTGQHFDSNMSDVFFKQMGIPEPDHNLDIHSLSHGAMTGRMLEKIEQVIISEEPDMVMVYGDTDSTLAGALAAKKLHVRLAHIEAGLRSNNMKMPEEINRILTDRISDILFCPTEQAKNNLVDEGYNNFNTKIVLSGDIMLDAANFYSKRATKPLFDIPDKYILATIHRAESTNNSSDLIQIFNAFEELSKKQSVIIPLHPRTQQKLSDIGFSPKGENLHITDPVGYLEIVWLLKNCSAVVTDSGGMQKEAFFFHKPCITVREETEWTELVKHNFNIVAGRKMENILNAFNKITERKLDYSINLYGDGTCAKKILKEIKSLQL